MENKLFVGIATLTGTVIGAGFLGIPYVVAKSGLLIGIIHMAVICAMMMLINLMLGEICLSSKQQHQLPGYASKYLGRKTKIFIFIASIIGYYSALVAYLIGEGESLSFIFAGDKSYALIAGLIFWFFLAFLTFGGIRKFKKIEPFAVIAVFLITLLIGLVNLPKIQLKNLSLINTNYLFLPFGVILFSFLGITSIPEVRRVLKGNEKLMKKSIILGSLIPFFVYLLFTIIVLGLYGEGVEEVATISFGKIVTLLGIFTMFTAFSALSLALEDTLRFDFNLKFKTAWFLTIFIPLLLFLIIKIFNLASFVKILGFGGSISGGLLSIAILLIHEHLQDRKRERKSEFKVRLPLIIKVLFICLFIVGILYEFL